MDQPAKTIASEGTDTHNWVGRIIVAVIMGEAIWSLIVSLMSNLVVPWLGDVMGQSSGLPTSFTQRPYDYPDLFVSVVQFCIAGIVAAILNHFFQRPRVGRVKLVKGPVSAALVEPLRVVPQVVPTSPAPIPQVSIPQVSAPQVSMSQVSIPQPPPTSAMAPVAAPVPVAKTDMVAPFAPVSVAPAAIPKPVPVASPAPATAPPAQPSKVEAKVEPAKPKKPKAVYYNIVGEPVPSDED